MTTENCVLHAKEVLYNCMDNFQVCMTSELNKIRESRDGQGDCSDIILDDRQLEVIKRLS